MNKLIELLYQSMHQSHPAKSTSRQSATKHAQHRHHALMTTQATHDDSNTKR